ncbi:hypothetical protein J6590_070908 [Homalodisca vitripennis]|nr:hypothetical protein J6590_070908 [Homalodisca vitripennis]
MAILSQPITIVLIVHLGKLSTNHELKPPLVGSYGFSVDPSFGGKSVYASAPSFGGKSVYAPAPSFGGKSVYAPAPSFGGKSVYAPASIFGGKSVYTPAPSFGGKSVYAPSPSYVAAPAPSYVSAPTPAPGYYPGLSSAPSKSGSLVERFRWRFIDYDFPSAEERYAAMAQQLYIPENNLPVGIEIWNNKLFVSVPRWAAGKILLILFVKLLLTPTTSTQRYPSDSTCHITSRKTLSCVFDVDSFNSCCS